MDLWIRSQDKKVLCSVKNIAIGEKYCIYASGIGVLGEYQTEERAMEVLDDIQKIILPKFKEIYPNKARIEKLNDTEFYQMPED